jgi:tripartite-type tricarboxylate transporter receptor subunit TctC
MIKLTRRSLVLGAAAAPFASPALAQTASGNITKIVVPFPPGGTVDPIARMVQPGLQQRLNTTIIIENKPGASGSIGAAQVAKAPPDGSNLLLVFDTHAVNHHIYKVAPDPFTKFEHLTLMVSSPSTLVSTTRFAAASLRDVVQRAKAESGRVTYATAGAASSNHLGALLLEQQAGVKMTHVHYKGGGPMIQALLGNQIDIAFISTPLILPHIQAGKVKAVAVGGRQRMAVLPDVPTLSETFPGFEQVSWFGLLAPAGVPKDVSGKIRAAMAGTLQTPEVRQRLSERGFDVVASSPEDFLRFVRAESDKLGKLIRDNGITVD